MLTICPAEISEMPIVRKLFEAYARSLAFDLGFQNFEKELDELPGDYAPPSGLVLLARITDEPVGCVAMRPLGEGICEMKRLYVRRDFQNQKIGLQLTERLLTAASLLGYRKMRLDTVATMSAAIRMYRHFGFYEIPAYRVNPVEGAAYFEKELTGKLE
jgi:putative acetyltransferase